MRFKFLLLLLSVTFVLASCVPKTGEDAVEVKTDGIFEPVTFTVVGGTDLGEILTGSDIRTITITVKNNSKFEITNLELSLFDNDESDMGMEYAVGENSGAPGFPGFGGTCQATKLLAFATCSIKLAMNPSRSGTFKQKLLFSYKNYVKSANVQQTLTALVGEPASLVLVGGQSFFNYGVLEQTVPTVRTEILQIENRGGLSARSVELAVLSSDNPSSFTLSEHNCPTKIAPGAGCQATVSYVPLNILETDPAHDYSATFTTSYIKDGKTASGSLNAFFQYKSIKIMGDFQTNQPVQEYNPDTIVGNYESKNISVSNKGYQDGIIQELIFKTSGGAILGVCHKQLAGPYLDCDDGETPATPVDLAQLPFRVEDLSHCMDVLTPGIRGETLGETCVFKVTFWPSVQYLVDKDFANTELWFKYDARWKDQVTIVDKKVFTLSANSKAAGKLIISDFQINGVSQLNLSADETMGWYDLGRLALITNSVYRMSLKIKLINVGNSPVTITRIQDGQAAGSGPQLVNDIVKTIVSQSDNPQNTYYEDMVTGCGAVPLQPNDFCFVQGYISPLFKSGQSELQDRLFLDYIVYDPGTGKPDTSVSFKNFHIVYRDSSTYEDDGTAHPDRFLDTKHTGILVQKGYLVFQNSNPLAGDMGSTYAGFNKTHKIVLQNVGTGAIPYIQIDAAKQLRKNVGPYPNGTYKNGGMSDYPFNIIQDGSGVGTLYDYDCYDLITPAGNAPLGVNETCALTVFATMDPLERLLNIDYATSEENRMNVADWENTANLWEPDPFMKNDVVTFEYYDGDVGLCPVGPCSGPLAFPGYDNTQGYFRTVPRDYTVQIAFFGLGKLTPTQITSPIDSAVVYRPPMHYPTITDGIGSQIGYNTPVWWSPPTTATEPTSRQILAPTHVGPMMTEADDYTFHAGTFPATGETYAVGFNLKNVSGTNVTIRGVSFSPALPAGLVATALPTVGQVINGAGLVPINFNFTPNTVLPGAPEVFDSVLHLTYDDGFHKQATANPVTAHYRILAEAFEVADAPGFSNTAADDDVKSQDWFVSYVAPGPATETLTGPSRNIPVKTHNFDSAFADTYFAVKNSAVYAKKTYTLKNNTAFPFDLSVFIKSTMGAAATADSANGYTLMNNNCNGKHMNPADTCTFDIKFVATTSTPATSTAYVHLNYNIQANQYINKAFQIQFTATDPANLAATGLTKYQTLELGTGTGAGYTWSSYSVAYGALAANPHIKQTTYPTVAGYPMTSPSTGVTITNSSSLKASFLKELANPPACSNPPICSGPNDNKILLYNGGPASQINVFATRGCFYGDDEFNGGIPLDQKGFNNATSAPKACKLFFEYWSNEYYTGTDIIAGFNMMHLKFYNNRWSSYDVLHFHLSGFVEPDFSSSVGTYSNVQATSAGTITFNWPVFSGVNGVWGSKVGYRIYFATSSAALNVLYTITSNYVDVGPTTHTYTFTGLVPGKYYYYKVAARRMKNAVTYTSLSTTLGLLTVVVPPVGSVYTSTIGANGSLVDKGLTAGFGFKSVAVSTCAGQKYTLNNGGTVYKNKQLINTTVWTFIKSDPDQTNYSTYSSYMPLATPHWLSDAPLGAGVLAGIFAPYGYSTLNMDQFVPKGPPPATPLLYRKPCTNTTCENLDKIVGGDGVDIPYDAVFYIRGDQTGAAYRCYAPL